MRPPFQAFQALLRPVRIASRDPRHHIFFRTYQRQSFGRGPAYKRFASPSGSPSGLFFRWAAQPTFYRDVGLITAGVAGVYVYNLELVPVSGRRRFNIISPELEERLGRKTVEEVKEQYRGQFLPEYDARVQQVKRVLERLLPFAEGEGLKAMNWEVHVIDSGEENAFVAPGGKVFVFTGILPLCESEDGIAAVLGHEVAHIVAHHTAERISQAPLLLLGILALSLLDISLSSSKILLDILLSMPASRKHEAEADYIGLLMMAQACYDPQAAMAFWSRMEKTAHKAPPQILSTHPSNHNREQMIKQWMPVAWGKAEASDCHVTREFADRFSEAFGSLGRW